MQIFGCCVSCVHNHERTSKALRYPVWGTTPCPCCGWCANASRMVAVYFRDVREVPPNMRGASDPVKYNRKGRRLRDNCDVLHIIKLQTGTDTRTTWPKGPNNNHTRSTINSEKVVSPNDGSMVQCEAKKGFRSSATCCLIPGTAP